MVNIFKDILINKDGWLQSKTGNDFEDRFETSLKQNGYNRLLVKDYRNKKNKMLSDIKEKVLDKEGTHFMENTFTSGDLKKAFFRNPYGSQEYPDFLVLTEKFIIPIEIKYSSGKSSCPMWNSNLPKSNGFYIFGSYGNKDVTFFNGEYVLPSNERAVLLEFHKKYVKPLEEEFKEYIKREADSGHLTFKRGFNVYARCAFEQNKVSNRGAQTNYFTAYDRDSVEQKTLALLEELC